MRFIFLFICFFVFKVVDAQDFQLDIATGISNYQGDLQPSVFTFAHSKPCFFGSLKYGLTPKIYLRGGFGLGSVGATDAGTRRDLETGRNLSFSSTIQEASLGLEYRFFKTSTFRLTPYIFACVGVFHFDPVTDYFGEMVHLQPLGTEGQGLPQYPNKKKYALTQMCIPFGGGLRYQVNCELSIGVEFGNRKLFTDYLDDVSGTYADKAALLSGRGQLAVNLAYRGNETDPNNLYPPAGSVRGNPKQNDWYYFFGLTVGLKFYDCETGLLSLGGLFNKIHTSKNRSSVDCPRIDR